MARNENSIESVVIKLSTTHAICDDLDRLVQTGYFGKSRAEAAEQLLRAELTRRIEAETFDKFIERSKRTKKR